MVELSIVVPCYNEEAVLFKTADRLLGVLSDLVRRGKIAASSSIYFVDDGSSDSTWRIICELGRDRNGVKGIKLSRNRGHQNALIAGLRHARGDAVITMDADLQHDPAAIEPMVDALAAGHDIVYGVRESRGSERLFKRVTGRLYYRALAAMGVEIVPEHADYRLLSRRAIDALAKFGEVEMFLRGLIPQLGFPSTSVRYTQHDRAAGESKYTLRKMLALAVQGVTSFSAAPLRFITAIGILVSIGSLCFSVYAFWVRVFTDSALPGWASTVVPMYFLGGVQLLALGIIGEYLAKVYMETKHRPNFLIEQIVGEREAAAPDEPQKKAEEAGRVLVKS